MKDENKKKFIQVFAIALIMLLIASASYAYFAARVSDASSTDIIVNTSTVDNLTFETGDAISISATQSNFGSGAGNQLGSTYASATLVANNDTNEASAYYSIYLNIPTNEFEYTTSEEYAELILIVTDEDGNLVTSIDGLNYTSVTDGEGNTVSGFDITGYTGSIAITEKHEIISYGIETDKWTVEVVFVNLSTDQSGNTGKELYAKLTIMQSGNTLQAVGSSSYSDKVWAYSDSITSIVFDDSGAIIGDYIEVYDISEDQDESILAYIVDNGEGSTYTIYIVSSLPIYSNEDMSYWFYDFESLESIEGLDKLITSNVTDMSYMFYWCSSLISLDLSNFDTSNVDYMNYMFCGCIGLTSLDLGSFDTSSVMTMQGMFNSCSNLISLNLSSFNTSNVISMWEMFYNCSSLTTLDLSSFDTSNVIYMTYMFYWCSSLISLDFSNADFSNVVGYSSMFTGNNSFIIVTVKDSIAQTFIQSRLNKYNGGTVVIA